MERWGVVRCVVLDVSGWKGEGAMSGKRGVVEGFTGGWYIL